MPDRSILRPNCQHTRATLLTARFGAADLGNMDMPRKPLKQRTAEQRVRQKATRVKAKANARPSRDDIARIYLYKTIVGKLKEEDGRTLLDTMRNDIVDDLELQGFDQNQSLDVFDDLVKKYSNPLSPFRPKRHLIKPPVEPDDGADL